MNIKKINFKQPKYIIPAIIFPFAIGLAYIISDFIGKKDEEKNIAPTSELSLSLGETQIQDSILSKNDAYDAFFTNRDNRTMLDGLEEERDSLYYYSDNLNEKQKRYIDSLNMERSFNRGNKVSSRESYYKPNERYSSNPDKDFERSAEIIKMLNEGATGRPTNNNIGYNNNSSESYKEKEEKDPVKTLRRQMIMLDSLEKSRDPEIQAQLKAQERLKKNREKMEAFLNNTLTVSKASLNPHFNSISREKENSFVRAVIDENMTSYLGSRIRIRLLEDVLIGKHKIKKGTMLYGQISGFSLQRVNLNIVSILNNGEILPINLSVYDVDGMQGLYVPASAFREMMRELGQNSIQGTQMDNTGEGFFTSLLSRAFQSTSRTIANLIRKNKAKIKYNTHIYLINEKELKKYESE